MTGAPTACAVRAAPYIAQEIRPKGLGGAGLPSSGYGYGLTGGPRAFMGPRIQRQWTMAKNARDVSSNVLPFLLDISLALYDTLDLVKASVDSEVVFQATLQVPAHHALTCRMQAYGSPFAAPDLQATADQLGDADLEFAACIAAPPDLDEQMSMNIGRVLSMLEENRAQLGQRAGPMARAGAAHAQQQAPAAGGTTAAQQLRSGNGGAQQQAPKVLVSVDDAEAGTAQLQRNNSAKKTTKLFSQGLGKRAMQALLGFGYLLTVLHERHLGGRIEFTAAALTAAGSATPSMGGSHVRHRAKSSSGGGMFAALRQMVQECPSLSPSSYILRRSSDGAAAAAQLQQYGSPLPHMSPSSLGNGASSFEVVWERISSLQPAKGPVQGLALQLSLSAPLGNSASSSAAHPHEDEIDITAQPRLSRNSDGSAAAAAAGEGSVSKLPEWGYSGIMDQFLDEAIQQLAAVQPAAAAAAAEEKEGPDLAAATGSVTGGSPATSARKTLQQSCFNDSSPFSKVQQQLELRTPAAGSAVSSHYLPDQGCLTSPAPTGKADAAAAAATAWQHLPHLTNKQPTSPLAQPLQAVQQQLPSPQAAVSNRPVTPATPPQGAAAAAAAAAVMMPPVTPTQQQQQLPAVSPRILRPMMSMRLTCQPKWQFHANLLDVAGGKASSAAAKPPSPSQQQQPHKRSAVLMHSENGTHAAADSEMAPVSGLWPTMSFTLTPVKIQPSQQQQQPAHAVGRA